MGYASLYDSLSSWVAKVQNVVIFQSQVDLIKSSLLTLGRFHNPSDPLDSYTKWVGHLGLL